MYFKITATITALIAFVLGLAVLMNYAKFERTFSGLTESRLAFMVQDLRDTLEFGLDLGLNPAAMANISAILAREVGRDPQILALSVFDDQGRMLYEHQSTGLRSPLSPLSPAWLEAVRRAPPTTPQRASDADSLMVGMPLINNFGHAVGGIVLRYDRAFHDQELEQALLGLIRAASLILLAASLIALLGVWRLFRDTRHDLRRVGAALERFLADGQSATAPPSRASLLDALYADAERESREFQQRLSQAERILRLEQQLAQQRKPS